MKQLVYIASILLVLIDFPLNAQLEPKQELRATWVATVSNIDWPKNSDRGNAAAQQADLIKMLDLYKSINLNAVFLQVRPECDALYNSSYEPWSRYLSSNQGDDPGYDPLQFAIDEAHKRGIELHAWINPYRINASTSDGGSYYHPTHVYSEHPEWAIEYDGGKKILNPGRPEVMTYIGSVIRDLVSNYHIDGVHFDDYFYAYGGTASSLDATEYSAYGDGMTLADWRRDNVNRLMDTVYRVIQEVNPNIRFGVSPFGIYRPGVPSGISGMDAYNTIYCDPLAWLQDGNVDYLTPQQYWPTGGGQDFETLTNWWANQIHSYGRHYYPGQGTYRLDDNPGLKKSSQDKTGLHETKYYFDMYLNEDGKMQNLSMMEESLKKATSDPVAAWTLGQIGEQIDIIRNNHEKNALGCVNFSAKDFTRVFGLADYLSAEKYKHKSLVPDMTWKTGTTPVAPSNLNTSLINNTYFLTWDYTQETNDRYAIYAGDAALTAAQITADASNLQAICFDKQTSLENLMISQGTSIVVTTVASRGKESNPGNKYTLSGIPIINLTTPLSGDTLSSDDNFSWNSDYSNPEYQVQIASNVSFSRIIDSSAWILASQSASSGFTLEGEKYYYWRVKARDTNKGPASSAVKIFTGFPAVQELMSPANLSENNPLHPIIEWSSTDGAEQIRIIISENSSFSTLLADESFAASASQATLSTKLDKNKWYYVKIQGLNSYGEGKFSSYRTFKTTSGVIPEVVLKSPDDGITAASFDHLVYSSPTDTGTISFELQVAADDAFTNVLINTGWIPDTAYTIEKLMLEGQRNYFWRVRAKSEFGTSEFSEYRSFFAGYPSRPVIDAPLHLSSDVPIQPLIRWTAGSETDSIYIEFAENSSYDNIRARQKFAAADGEGYLSTGSLKGYTWYFLHIRGENEYGKGVFSANKYFETGEGNNVRFNEIHPSVNIFPTFLVDENLIIDIFVSENEKTDIEITSLSGQRIYKKQNIPVFEGQKNIVNIPNYIFTGNGMYVVRIITTNGIVSKKIVVNRK